MHIVSIVGARPQFIKLSPLSKGIRERGFFETVLHTGQHYDHNMSKLFFEELEIPSPNYNLKIGSASHGTQTGKMMISIEEVLCKLNPDIVLVFGDTNSTLAGALTASKLDLPVAHIEAGLRSFNKKMPEELNRIMTDHISDYLFCPNQNAINNLMREGIQKGIYLVGDLMHDSVMHFSKIARQKSTILKNLGLNSGKYLFVTVHRAENTDNFEKLNNIIDALNELDFQVIFPLHPRTKKKIEDFGLFEKIKRNIVLIDPVGYLDMLCLEMNAYSILTDSGGVQKEAYWMKIPCITLRNETEWIETVESGWNTLVGSDKQLIINNVKSLQYGIVEQENKTDCTEMICDILSSIAVKR